MFKSLGHLLLATIFISGGAGSFINPQPRAARVADAGIPEAHSAVILNAAAMVLGGTALALNIVPRVSAALLIGTLIPTTLVGHPYWKEKDAASRAGQQIQFLKNLAALGGLLLVMAEKDE